MPVPKRKTSKRRRDLRRGHHKLAQPHQIRSCPQCAEPVPMHQVCGSCGYFKGKEVIEIPLE